MLSALCCCFFSSRSDAADDPLAKARALYNQHQYEAAVNAAEKARLTPGRADSADLIAARAYLERFRQSAASDDLTNARDRLRRLDPQRFDARERLEYIVGIGEALYLDGAFGAAAAIFDSVLLGPDLLSGDARERVLDWWADTIDREAHVRPASNGASDRAAMYRRIRARMEDELATHPANGSAAYWLAAAARAQGDAQAAWDAAEAAWARAPLAADRGAALRADVDRLMTRGIIPERAKALAQPPATLLADWERFKERWKR
ncbi:MAG TPA: hypothetical protein VGY57_08155 [Vicinamibacterales bacterium]|nr:hypothetical protein [Vicinamibacterales bacterium]